MGNLNGETNMDEAVQIDEVLNVSQRMKRSQIFKRYKGKLKASRERASKKLADKGHLVNRSKRAAIMLIRKRVAGNMGANYANLSASQKMIVDRKVHARKNLVNKLAVRLYSKVKRAETDRFKNRSSGGNK